MKKVGLLGGTFDPPHIGHLLMAEEARVQLKLDEVWWMPNKIPPHKKKDSSTNDKERITMVELMTKTNDSFTVCDVEFKREGPSYTVDTIEHLKGEFPKNEFFFIIGGDSLETLPTWHESERLQSLIPFVVIERPGFPIQKNDHPGNIHLLEAPAIDVSSTYIREKFNTDQFNRFLMTNEVYEFIKEHKLYE
ncbi:nicotinate-nucleotide adenylyltransferase [Evansella halocellulosilytica]|uniref:nicotinate-nucleotide adenylyltransferase n=1 Tax=Evansella halocellulosilytica TaxID=2011013 RepID=UPI000BB6CACC|nr:nicotinate-nucleotide adenylyltransferase [Evansella halocellulosilytica]